MPKVSVVMPVYNGAKHIREAIDSVLAQTYTDWDFWIINEYGSNDGSAEIAAEYASRDSRFHLVQNEERLGLAESLNLGFRLSGGEYIARLDADDLALPERFAKQVALLDSQPKVGICGTWQHHFGRDTDWVHKPLASADDCRARLLFNCDLCHSTLMLRRQTVFEHNLFYDNSFYAEDYELWCRAMLVTDIVNIPEVLGEYRVGEDNITASKKEMLDLESGRLVGRNLEKALGLRLTEAECELFRGWSNPFDKYAGAVRQAKLAALERILRRIYGVNRKKRFFAERSLLSVLAAKWRWARYGAPWDTFDEINELSQIFDENYKPSFGLRYKNFCAHNKTMGAKAKKICVVMLRPLARPFRRRIEGLLNNLEKNICDFVEAKTWDRYLRISAELKQDYVKLINQQQQYILFLQQRLNKLEQNINQVTDGRIWLAEQNINQATDSRIWQAEQNINQVTDGRIWQAEQNINQVTDSRIWQAEKNINQATDSRIWQAEQNINQVTDGRIWQAEQNINQVTDGRIWQAEKNINQATDSRIWQAEQNVNQATDGRIWQAEQNINQVTDGRIWQAEQNINQVTDGRIWQAEKNINQATDSRIWQAEQNINQVTDGRIWQAEKRIFKKLDAGFWNLYYERNKDNDSWKNTSESDIYDELFYIYNRYGSVMSARIILGFVLSKIKCNSLVDFGCGTGTWLWVALNYGVAEVLGIDGDYVPGEMLMIPTSCFLSADLSKPFCTTKKYDMAMSLEVAEHLSCESADDFVSSICNSSDIILFSAAHPGQGGDGHINEQPIEYWLEKFAKHKYEPIEIKQYFQNDEKVEWWYKDNVVLMVQQEHYDEILSKIIS